MDHRRDTRVSAGIVLATLVTLTCPAQAKPVSDIAIAAIATGRLYVVGTTERPGTPVVLEDRFKAESDARGEFQFEVLYHPARCIVGVQIDGKTYEAVVSNCGQQVQPGEAASVGSTGAVSRTTPPGLPAPQGQVAAQSQAAVQGQGATQVQGAVQGLPGPQRMPAAQKPTAAQASTATQVPAAAQAPTATQAPTAAQAPTARQALPGSPAPAGSPDAGAGAAATNPLLAAPVARTPPPPMANAQIRRPPMPPRRPKIHRKPPRHEDVVEPVEPPAAD